MIFRHHLIRCSARTPLTGARPGYADGKDGTGLSITFRAGALCAYVLRLVLGVVLVGMALRAAAAEERALPDFAANVTRHVLFHEMGHAVFREFATPVLANEETLADAFATAMILQHRRDDALAILTARVRSWLYEDTEVAPAERDFRSEHDLDIRRAYQTACLLYGADPAEWADDLAWVGFSDGQLADCSDTAPDQIAGWTKVLTPLQRPTDSPSDKITVSYDAAPLTAAVQASRVMDDAAAFARRFDWPEPVRLHFARCDGGASWSRRTRTIRLCDSYVARFIEQGSVLRKRD